MAKKEEIIYTEEENGASDKIESKVKKLKKQLGQCQKEKEEYLSQAQRARADLVNYRRRQEQILEEFKKYGQANLIRDFMPLMDSLDVAVKNDKSGAGFENIKKQLESILKQYGVEEIKAVGEPFNPQYQEAIDIVESEEESGIVIEEIQKGYKLGDKILRISKVRVAK